MGQAASSIYNYYYPSNNDNENNNNDAPLLPEVIRESDVFSHVAAPLILKSLKERGIINIIINIYAIYHIRFRYKTNH